MLVRRGCLLIGLIVAVGACGAASGRVPDSGISGRVVAGPTCPVERVPPLPGCAPRPLAVTLRFRRLVGGTARGTTIRSGADGRFRVRLAPGTYLVLPLPRAGSPFPRPPGEAVEIVHPHRFTFVTITYDTGIR
jgi:hypothetical protein